jgi:hypothetical protein
VKKSILLLLSVFVFGPVSLFGATVNLAWDRSPDPGVAGYNLYRGTQSGGPYTKLNLNLIPQTAVSDTPMYTDMTPTGSQLSYFYVVRAQSLGGVESVNSNEVIFNPPPAAPTNLRIVSFTIANLNVDGVKVASGPPYPIVYVLPRQTPPRLVPITVTVMP